MRTDSLQAAPLKLAGAFIQSGCGACTSSQVEQTPWGHGYPESVANEAMIWLS